MLHLLRESKERPELHLANIHFQVCSQSTYRAIHASSRGSVKLHSEGGNKRQQRRGGGVVAHCKHSGSVEGTLNDRHGRHSFKYTYVQNRNDVTPQKQLRIAGFHFLGGALQEN